MNTILIIFVLSLLSIFFMSALLLSGGNYFYNLAIDTSTSKASVFKSRDDLEKSTYAQRELNKDKEDREWFENCSNYEEVYIDSFDKLKLHGFEIRNCYKTNRWVIAVHGYDGNSMKMCGRARHFYNMGYNVLIPDLRGHGKSEGNYIGMGWHDRKDILGWIDYITEKYEDCEIILYGISMGASTVMMTCGENLKSNVKAAIEDSGYTCVWDQFAYILKCMFKLPKFPMMYVANMIIKIRAKYDLKEASSVNQLAKSKIPILFIHGDKDKFVPFNMLKKVYESAPCQKEMLIVEGAGHCKSNKVNPKLYWSTISEFLDKYICCNEDKIIM